MRQDLNGLHPRPRIHKFHPCLSMIRCLQEELVPGIAMPPRVPKWRHDSTLRLHIETASEKKVSEAKVSTLIHTHKTFDRFQTGG